MKRLLVAASAATLVAAVGVVGATASAETTPTDAELTSAAVLAADQYVANDAQTLHLSDSDTVSRTSVSRTLGLTFVSYERTHQGLDVIGGDFVVATSDSGDVKYTQVAQDIEIDLASIEPRLSISDIQDTITTSSTTPELVVVTWDDPALAYVSTSEGIEDDGAPFLRDTYIDANTGEVLYTIDRIVAGTGDSYYNGTVDLPTSEDGSGFVMEDPTRPGLSCAEEGGSPLTNAQDTWGNGSGTDIETACVDAFFAAAQEWDMLDAWLDRDGIDGDGGAFPLYVGMNMVNAYWNGYSATFGHSDDDQRQLVTMDVVAHELGHGIFQTTPGGSSGGNETGGLNEATGDIFGALTEWYTNHPVGDGYDSPDYLVGEDAGLITPGKPIRDMADPAALDHPACWSEDMPSTEVHAGAGPLNHWFYLLAEGTEAGGDGVPGSTTCDGTTITDGLGIEIAGKIFMGALMGKTSYWTYEDARTAALEFAASSDLFTTCDEFDATKAAFDAVSVPATNDPTCSK